MADRQTDGFSALYSRRLATTGTIWHENFNVILWAKSLRLKVDEILTLQSSVSCLMLL